MARYNALICDTERRFAKTLTACFQQRGWSVHVTNDDAEAGYRLLMWFGEEELPRIAVLIMDDEDELYDFCLLLKEQEILSQVQVLVFLDESTEAAAGFRQLGTIPLIKSADPWPQVQAVLDRLAEGQDGGDSTASPATQRLLSHQHASVNHQHSEQPSFAKSRSSVSSGKLRS